jgi:hypothetical protein
MSSDTRRFTVLAVAIAVAAALLVGCSNPTGSDDGGDSTTDTGSNTGSPDSTTDPGTDSDGGTNLGGTFGPVEEAHIGADRDTSGGNTLISIIMSTEAFESPGAAPLESDVVKVDLSRTSEITSVQDLSFDLGSGGSIPEGWTVTASYRTGDVTNATFQVTGGSLTVSTGDFIAAGVGSTISLSVSGTLHVEVTSDDLNTTFEVELDYSGQATLYDWSTVTL